MDPLRTVECSRTRNLHDFTHNQNLMHLIETDCENGRSITLVQIVSHSNTYELIQLLQNYPHFQSEEAGSFSSPKDVKRTSTVLPSHIF